MIVSYQLNDWWVDDNNITFGGNVTESFRGDLIRNYVLAESPFFWNLNY